jgi:hypothetical protein
MRAWLGLALALAACSGDTATTDSDTGATTDSDSTTDTDSPTDSTPAGPTFGEVWDDHLEQGCALAGCHAIGSGNGMEISESTGHAALVGVSAVDAPGEVYVIPGDPDNSYLIRKMEEAPGIVGDPMPPPFGWADCCQTDIDAVRAWIAAGALP